MLPGIFLRSLVASKTKVHRIESYKKGYVKACAEKKYITAVDRHITRTNLGTYSLSSAIARGRIALIATCLYLFLLGGHRCKT